MKFVFLSFPTKAEIFHPRFRSDYPSSTPYFLVLTSHRRFSSYSWAGEVLEVCRPLIQENCNISSSFREWLPFFHSILPSYNISPSFQILFLGSRSACFLKIKSSFHRCFPIFPGFSIPPSFRKSEAWFLLSPIFTPESNNLYFLRSLLRMAHLF